MNYEQRYKEMLAEARTFYKKWDGVDAYNSSLAISELKEIFPELKESKKEWIEKIRQELKSYLGHRKTEQISESDAVQQWITWLEKQGEQNPVWSEDDEAKLNGILSCVERCQDKDTEARFDGNREIDLKHYITMFDWLKSLKERVQSKQGEQKPNDKVEPMFHGGDFITHNTTNIIYKVITVDSDSYNVESIKTSCRIELFNAEQNFHLWTIKDAKEGDILYSPKHDLLWIYKNKDEYHVASNGNFISVESIIEISSDVRPATKEQRDFLFQKMKVYGYEWHADKKEVIRLDVTEW